MLNYYEVLGIAENANRSEIRKAYKRLAFQYHPDKNKDPEAEEMFKMLNKAYRLLSDPSQKLQYDLSLLKKEILFNEQNTYGVPPPSYAPVSHKKYKKIWLLTVSFFLLVVAFSVWSYWKMNALNEEKHMTRAKYWYEKKAYRDAEKEFLIVIDLNAEQAEAYFYLSKIALEGEYDLDKALDYIDHALQIKAHFNYIKLRSFYRFYDGDYKTALEDVRLGLILCPGDTELSELSVIIKRELDS